MPDLITSIARLQNELRIDIASVLFVLFDKRKYPHDTKRQVESLDVKLRAHDSVLKRLQPEQKREGGVTANVLLPSLNG